MTKVGIIGGTGYVAGELIRCLVNHPKVTIDFIYSHSQPGTPVHLVHQDLFAYPSLVFTDQINPAVDVVFLCVGHGQAAAFLAKHTFDTSAKIIDLSRDFRLQADAVYKKKSFVYGLPELNITAIEQATCIANPGCFATAIQLSLLPLANEHLLKDEVHVQAITGATGAGQTPQATTHFNWRESNVSVYKAFIHQHLGEIYQSIQQLQASFQNQINFIPMRGNFTRGILATTYTHSDLSASQLEELYHAYYQNCAFTQISKQPIHLKQVINTNF
ncbi:MAG: N-acetyl-gamma-glutamyl-phosphate reductase, partial [Bacteroidota bacterium]